MEQTEGERSLPCPADLIFPWHSILTCTHARAHTHTCAHMHTAYYHTHASSPFLQKPTRQVALVWVTFCLSKDSLN